MAQERSRDSDTIPALKIQLPTFVLEAMNAAVVRVDGRVERGLGLATCDVSDLARMGVLR